MIERALLCLVLEADVMSHRLLLGFFCFVAAAALGLGGAAHVWARPQVNSGDAAKSVEPSSVTLAGDAISLKDALGKLKQQTGIEVIDKRLDKTNPSLKLNLKKATFWQALDTIAREARVVVSLYQGDGQSALVDGIYRPFAVSYNGVFRTVIKRIAVTKNFDTDTHYCVVSLEVTWEPRLEPLYLTRTVTSIEFTNGGGKKMVIDQKEKDEIAAFGRTFLDFEVRFPAPARAVKQIDLFKGDLSVITPTKMLLFTFNKLTRITEGTRPLQKVKDGVTVRLVKLNPDDDPWDVQITLDYPKSSTHFESYQSWLVNNDIYLEHRRTHLKRRPQGNQEKRTDRHADIVYYFGNSRPKLGKPSDWKLVYRTPGKIVTLNVPFEFKNLPLP
jgi:hypothetical protein